MICSKLLKLAEIEGNWDRKEKGKFCIMLIHDCVVVVVVVDPFAQLDFLVLVHFIVGAQQLPRPFSFVSPRRHFLSLVICVCVCVFVFQLFIESCSLFLTLQNIDQVNSYAYTQRA